MLKMAMLSFITLLAFGCANNELEQQRGVNEFDLAEETSDFIIEGEEEDGLSFENVAPEPVIEEKIEVPQKSMGEYVVKENDTLMLIAFKLYGDYTKWRDLLAENPGIGEKSLQGVEKILYQKDQAKFEWRPRGNPFLIKRGDSLSKISGDVYGVYKRWREIYNNNREMIKDPNLIFAGFTLYYVPDRALASE